MLYTLAALKAFPNPSLSSLFQREERLLDDFVMEDSTFPPLEKGDQGRFYGFQRS